MNKIHRFQLDKLLRANAAAHMRHSGMEVRERVLKREEYIKKLNDKLLEEAQEAVEASSQKHSVEELADVIEAIRAMALIYNMDLADILKLAQEKRAEKGGYEARIYGEYVEVSEDHPRFQHYKSQPEKYPEIK